MVLKKVISGGQTGADRAGLDEAKSRGIATGGWVPKGYRTEQGFDLSLKVFDVQETSTAFYPQRTRYNVRDSSVTVWFGNVGSAGYLCTKKACKEFGKPLIENPTPARFRELAEIYEVINIAGNRESTNPQVISMVNQVFKGLDS